MITAVNTPLKISENVHNICNTSALKIKKMSKRILNTCNNSALQKQKSNSIVDKIHLFPCERLGLGLSRSRQWCVIHGVMGQTNSCFPEPWPLGSIKHWPPTGSQRRQRRPLQHFLHVNGRLWAVGQRSARRWPVIDLVVRVVQGGCLSGYGSSHWAAVP